MPSALESGASTAKHDDLDNYDVGDFSDDPFTSPPPADASNKKRKEPDSGLGIDEEVNVQKRVRVPNVKLDEERLLGPAGIPKLRKRAKDLKIKGKGHEFSDAARLLSFYQLWLDDLFPKAKFLDALTMVEKAGHKKRLMAARNEFINERRPKDRGDDEQNEEEDEDFGAAQDGGPTTSATTIPKPTTPPPNDDVPDDDDDLYGATPRRSHTSIPIRNQVPDEDDLDALIAEAEGRDQPTQPKANPTQPAITDPNGDPEDDLDALIAEAEAQDKEAQKQNDAAKTTNTGGGDDFADEEAAMQEMEGLW